MNRFMKKFKAVYCNASFIFAIAVLMVTISLCIFYPDSVNASQSPSPSGDISTNDVTNDLDDVKSLDSGDKDLADATSDSTNGLNIYYNNESGSLSTPVRMFLVLTVLSLAPSILIMLTSFTRIIIVLHFVRTAIGTQTAPPNQVLVGLALFLTLFIMWPTFSQVNEKAIKPLDEGKITQQEAIKEAEGPFREFMYGQTQTKDIKLFVDISGDEYDDYDDVPFTTLVPAFILSELRTAFILGFLIYIPFIVIDMVVSSVLMSMGMMMLPPTTISMPFKVLLFILADGWDLVLVIWLRRFTRRCTYDYPGSCFGYCQRGNLYYNHYISSAFAYFADCRTYSQYISDSYVNSGADTYICAKNNCNFSCDDALWLMDARHYVRIYD